MAGNFFQSSHYQQWILDRQDIVLGRADDLRCLGNSEDDYQKVMIFFSNLIQVLGEQLKVRQQVIATATVYIKRFYARRIVNDSLRTDVSLLYAPHQIAIACMHIACVALNRERDQKEMKNWFSELSVDMDKPTLCRKLASRRPQEPGGFTTPWRRQAGVLSQILLIGAVFGELLIVWNFGDRMVGSQFQEKCIKTVFGHTKHVHS